jgi:3-O-methylgallate 3,4-dioxygenase
MADVVLGFGSSHAPQLRMRAKDWPLLLNKDSNDKRYDYQAQLKKAKPDMESELTPEVMELRDQSNHRALGILRDKLTEAAPDAIVVIGDDQHEQFYEENMPMFSIYRGEKLPIRSGGHNRTQESSNFRPAGVNWNIGDRAEETDHPAAPELAEHLIHELVESGFDIAASNKLRDEVGVGHAFSFMYQYIMPELEIPIVPVMVNAFFPPNQPTPRRSYQLGQGIRAALENWDANKKVVVVASGGLSHFIIDEDIDRQLLNAMQNKDVEAMANLDRDRLMVLGTTEGVNWLTLAGAMEPEPMTLIDYVPCYRTPAGTGCAMAFAYWE